jgi:hypothetical protein
LFFYGCTGDVPDDLIDAEKVPGIIFVKTTRTNTLNGAARGGNLFSLIPASPDGELTNLTKLTSGDVCDPEISYDGLKVLFSMRPDGGGSFNIYEMNIDGSNLRQLTDDPRHDDHDPTYLPNGRILFTSNRPGFVDEYNKAEAEVLHIMDKDGSKIEQISFNASDDFDPFVMKDGRVVYTRWDHHGNINRFPLFFTNPDGHGTFTFFSPHRMRTFFHARELADGSVIAVHSDMVNGDRGPLVIIKNPDNSGEPLEEGDVVNITPHIETDGPPYKNGTFKYPHPLPDGRLIVSYTSEYDVYINEQGEEVEEIPDYGLFTLKQDGGDLRLLYNDPDFQEYDAVVISTRPMPPVIPSTLDKTQATGVFTVESVYHRQHNDGQEVPNQAIQEVKQVMVIEGIPTPRGDREEIGASEFERKRILGTAPVHADGSFSIRVPSNIPLSFNTLDSLGRAIVVKRNWVTIRPSEQFEKCSGCHGPRGRSSGNLNPIAGTMPPTELLRPEAEREDVSFRHAIEPIIAAKCEGCHSGEQPAGELELVLTKSLVEPLFSIAYMNLMGVDMEDEENMENRNKYVTEPFSRRSKLINMLLGFDGPKHPPEGGYTLTRDEIRKFINWVDMGAQYR